MKLLHVYKIYHNQLEDVIVFNDVNITIPVSGFVLITGESGFGKSTLFNMVTGIDNDYQGKIDNNSHIEYLTQKILLFENLSVLENLMIVCQDKCYILKMLETFQLLDLEDKIVKTLSTGEKRRVQIIRSLLVTPDILLCDEPTASLDYDNAIIVSRFLKKVSEHTAVYVITHDIELFQPLADSVYEIKDKKIICTKRNDIIYTHEKKSIQTKHSLKDYKQLCKYYMKSHLFSFVFTLVLILCIVISSYASVYYLYTSGKELQRQQWYYSSQLVQTVPNETVYNSLLNRYMYTNHDFYTYQQLYSIIEESEDIIGYSIQRTRLDSDLSYLYLNEEAWKGLKTYTDEGYKFFLAPDAYFGVIKEIDNRDSAYKYTDSHVYMYNIIQPDRLPLIYGTFPQNDYEVILDQNTAKQYADVNNIENIEDIVGQVITLDTQPYNTLNNTSNVKANISLKVTGITDYNNYFEKRIYFRNQAFEKICGETYDYFYQDIYYFMLKILYEPGEPVEEICEQLNHSSWVINDQFKVFDSMDKALNQTIKAVNINSTFVVIGSSVFGIIAFITMIMNKFYFKEQTRKEKRIIEQYHYSYQKFENIYNLILMIIIIISSIVVIPGIFMMINALSQMILNRQFIVIDMTTLIICCGIVFIVYMICDFLFIKYVIGRR